LGLDGGRLFGGQNDIVVRIAAIVNDFEYIIYLWFNDGEGSAVFHFQRHGQIMELEQRLYLAFPNEIDRFLPGDLRLRR
jgi:hypothetical protein